MDEEEQRRQASAAAFGGAASNAVQPYSGTFRHRDNPNAYSYSADTSRDGIQHGPSLTNDSARVASPDYTLRRNGDADTTFSNDGAESFRNSVLTAASAQQAMNGLTLAGARVHALAPETQASVPGASEAFGQLDAAPNADPTQFDDRMAEGTQEGVGEVLRQSFDENLRAARDAVSGQARRDRFGGEQRREGDRSSDIAQYRDRLLKMADQALAGGGEQQRQPQDPYAQQREREALVAKRLGTFDLFSDSRTTRTPISAQTVQTDAYDKVLMGKDNKDLFDSFL